MQISMFDGTKRFTIDKPIRLISLFSGYDSQLFALKYLGLDVESWRTCEWAVKSIQALKDAHFGQDDTDYSQHLKDDVVFEILYKLGISANYNEPMTKEQIKRLGEQKARTIYNNIRATHNMVNIQRVHGEDLGIVDKDKYCYIMTYSFPCQDLSSAGKGAGMAKGSGTRSGMLWEVERILDECKELPQVLLMENVPEVIGTNNIQHFAKWLEKLESMGYHCYWKVLNAKDYGIPQNRERCFMVSILGDYYFEFPKEIPLEYKLKDLLEKNVDEEYYLSDRYKYISTEALNTDKLRDALYKKVLEDETTQEFDVIGTNYTSLRVSGEKPIKLQNNKSPTLTTSCGDELAVVVENTYAGTFDYRIRKLIPKECFRLMGVKDEDFEKIAKNQSNASLYHLAGDSIVVDVLMAIFGQMIAKN